MANGNVVLLYVRGITRQDTPYFPNLAAQEAFFGNINLSTRIEVGDGYYPPHYNDVLSVETSDFEPLGGTNAYNYLYLVFRTKRYYYFIDDIEYVNENLVRLHITMDIIQTHMFDAHVRSGVIERKFITRNHLSGRNYIRENLSMGNMILREKTPYDLTNSHITSCYLLKFTYSGGTPPSASNNKTIVENGASAGPQFDFPYYYYILPLGANSIYDDKFSIYRDDLSAYTDYSVSEALTHFGREANCVEIVYLPFCDIEVKTINDVTGDVVRYVERTANGFIIHSTSNVGIEFDTDYGVIRMVTSPDTIYHNETIFNLIVKGHTVTHDSSRATETRFMKGHVPALIDENYMSIAFGTPVSNCPVNLHLLTSTNIKLKCSVTPDGARIYSTGEASFTSYTDISAMTIADTTPFKYTTVNDPWNTFLSYNAGTLLTQGITSIAEMISGGFMYGGAMRAAELSKQMLALGANRLTQEFNLGQLRRLSDVNKQIASVRYGFDMSENALQRAGIEQPSATKAVGSGISSIVQLAGQCINARNQPQSIKENTNIFTQNGIANFGLVKLVYEVEDINRVAEYYHRNGYLVLEPYNPLPNPETGNVQDELIDLINYINTRYYYNILKMSEVSCFTTNDNTLDTQALLEDRLTKGVRFWNPVQGMIIGNFYFDNVEKEYVNE